MPQQQQRPDTILSLWNEENKAVHVVYPSSWEQAIALWKLVLICPRIETDSGTQYIESVCVMQVRTH